MGDSRRFDLFAKLITTQFPVVSFHKVADVAGGHGYLQTSLRSFGYNVTTFDKRKGRKNRPGKFQYQYRYFDHCIKESFDLLVGMHPDEATDVIIIEADKRSIPFAVVPCCIMPTISTFFGDHNFKAWVNHLKNLAVKTHNVSELYLKMQGRNLVLIGKVKR